MLVWPPSAPLAVNTNRPAQKSTGHQTAGPAWSTKATLIDKLNRMKADLLDQWGLSGDLLKDTGDHQSCAVFFAARFYYVHTRVCVLVCVCVC
jgi:hypothetical protein